MRSRGGLGVRSGSGRHCGCVCPPPQPPTLRCPPPACTGLGDRVAARGGGGAHCLVVPAPLQPPLGDGHHLLAQVLHRAPAERRLQALPGHVGAEVRALLLRPVRHHRPRLLLCGVVIQDTHPQGGEGADLPPGPRVGAPHLEEPLHADLREHRGEVVLPVAHRRQPPGGRGELPLHEVPEALPARVLVPAIVHKVHGHVHHVVGVLLKPKALLKNEGQVPAAVVVRVGPDVRAVALEAVDLAVLEGRVGKERRRHRLQRQGDAELLDHVRLGLKVEVYLDRAAAEHHVEPHRPNLGHIRLHDVVAPLGHHSHILHPRNWVEACAQKADADVLTHRLDLIEVVVDLCTRLVDGLQWRAAELKLPARLEGDALPVLQEPNDVAILHHGLPSEALLQLLEQLPDMVVVDALVGPKYEPELLVLGPDPPLVAGLAPAEEMLDHLVVGDGWATVRRRGRGRGDHADAAARPPDCGGGERAVGAGVERAGGE
mmetsp:Transcript_12178/g.38569  ORF Transcript_12178/g.38569 Transcript_12178/m.38569 type:complete len:487 (-) Transcript_12178:265-1725(-)